MSNLSFVVNGQSEEPPQGGIVSSGLANDQREELSGRHIIQMVGPHKSDW